VIRVEYAVFPSGQTLIPFLPVAYPTVEALENSVSSAAGNDAMQVTVFEAPYGLDGHSRLPCQVDPLLQLQGEDFICLSTDTERLLIAPRQPAAAPDVDSHGIA